MKFIMNIWNGLTILMSHKMAEGAALFLTRLALAGVFWRSARTKVEPDSFLSISDTTFFLFSSEYNIIFPKISAYLATYGEHIFALLVVFGLATRFGALGLLVITLVIQLFVYPEAWWPQHSLWVAMALVLITRGGGTFSLDALWARMRG